MEERDRRPDSLPDSFLDCGQFEQRISDYLDDEMERFQRRPFAEHLLACPPCHQLFNEVRAVMEACRQVFRLSPTPHLLEVEGVEERLVEATSAGAMLSCPALDQLIFDYFMREREREEREETGDSVLPPSPLAPHSFVPTTHTGRVVEPADPVVQPFEEHFALCESCRRLVEGVRQSLEVVPEGVVSDQLYGRILAATVGGR